MKNPQTRYPIVQKVQSHGSGIFLQERKICGISIKRIKNIKKTQTFSRNVLTNNLPGAIL